MTRGELTLAHKPVFEQRLGVVPSRRLSAYAFPALYIWRSHYTVSCAEVGGLWCVFFTDVIGTFMPCAPCGGALQAEVVALAFAEMGRLNENDAISRIENIAQQDVAFFESLGYVVAPKPGDYVCPRESIASLAGNALKHKRAGANHFVKQYRHVSAAYQPEDRQECLGLYEAWMAERAARYPDPLYRGMLTDSAGALKVALEDFEALGLQGMVVRVDGALKGFTIGCPVSPDTFCIMYEVTDLSCKGLSQFIFKSFAGALSQYTYLNLMDDSGLENLREVKGSFHPVTIEPAYIATRAQ